MATHKSAVKRAKQNAKRRLRNRIIRSSYRTEIKKYLALIAENNLAGALVGILTTDDVDTNDVHSYILVSGDGADDNSSFTLLGNLLLAIESFDFETKSSYTIRIRSIDNANNYTENVFIITVGPVRDRPG